MCTRRQTCIRLASLFAAGVAPSRAQTGSRNGNRQELTIPFDFAAERGSLLIRARVNSRPVRLIVDTGSAHTILLPAVAGVNPGELRAPRSGAGVIGDAVGREVTLEVGPRTWRRRVSIMDLSAVLTPYRERIDGLLGIDFLLEFSEAVIDFRARSIRFVG